MLKTSKKEKESFPTQMVGRNSRTRTNYFRRGKSSFIESIPDEVLFEILLRLPAQDIYFGARLVCWKWYHMVRSRNFIHEHHERASSGLLCWEGSDFVSMYAREDGGIDTYKLNYEPTNRYPVRSSWNGMMLECEFMSGKLNYHVRNILTNQILRLPQSPYFVHSFVWSGMGYDATSMTSKVVVTYKSSEGYLCGILTLGVDKSWRTVRSDHLSDLGKLALSSESISTEGFVHWNKQCGSFVTLNLETEILAEPPPPLVLLEQNIELSFLSARRHVSLFVQRERLAWEVFEMKPEIGEWTKLSEIYLDSQNDKIESFLIGYNLKHYGFKIEPWGWLKYPEVLALRIEYVLTIFYNLITCEIDNKKLYDWPGGRVLPCKNSLVWMGGP